MGGTATSMRKNAEYVLNQAISNKAKKEDIAVLQASYDAARAEELRQTGKNEQAKGLF